VVFFSDIQKYFSKLVNGFLKEKIHFNSKGIFEYRRMSIARLSPNFVSDVGSVEDRCTGGDSGVSSAATSPLTVYSTVCSLCSETYTQPKVLPCLHTFCFQCLGNLKTPEDKLQCPECQEEATLTNLVSDYAALNILGLTDSTTPFHCTGCKNMNEEAVARCISCSSFLCPNCVAAHQYMHCFDGHAVFSLEELMNSRENQNEVDNPVLCLKHKHCFVKYFCKTCSIPICTECKLHEHLAPGHDYQPLNKVAEEQVQELVVKVEESRDRSNQLLATLSGIDEGYSSLQQLYNAALSKLHDTCHFYDLSVEEMKDETLKDLETAFEKQQKTMSELGERSQVAIDRFSEAAEFVEKQVKLASNTQVLMYSGAFQSRYNELSSCRTQLPATEIQFIRNYQEIKESVRNNFGYVRSESSNGFKKLPQPIARPIGRNNALNLLPNPSNVPLSSNPIDIFGSPRWIPNIFVDPPNELLNDQPSSDFMLNHTANQFIPGSISTSLTDLARSCGSSGSSVEGGSSIMGVSQADYSDQLGLANLDSHSNMSPEIVRNITQFPPVRRQKMIYHYKFGEFGVMPGQFTEPSGVAVNALDDIIVADTNNHRIQIFDREGRFKFQFGECGKRDGQLLYPNRVSVVKATGNIVVTERSPTHQIQIFNQYGQFVRKFGANILQHPRGITVDNMGRIVVVECKVMRVIIFDQQGHVLSKFGCSKHLEFPNGVAVNDKQEVFISDNRAHCVKVLSYEGVYLRSIGGEGITNYPIGVGIDQNGHVVVADNHNNFNLTTFTQGGELVSALESKVKHAQCFDVSIMGGGSAVLSSKDYRIYVYRYQLVPNFTL